MLLGPGRTVVILLLAGASPFGRTCELPVNVIVEVVHVFVEQRLLQHVHVRLKLQILVTRRNEPSRNIVKAVKKEVRRDQMAQREEKKEEGGGVGLRHCAEFGAVGECGVFHSEKHDKLYNDQHVGSEEGDRDQPQLLSPHFYEVGRQALFVVALGQIDLLLGIEQVLHLQALHVDANGEEEVENAHRDLVV